MIPTISLVAAAITGILFTAATNSVVAAPHEATPYTMSPEHLEHPDNSTTDPEEPPTFFTTFTEEELAVWNGVKRLPGYVPVNLTWDGHASNTSIPHTHDGAPDHRRYIIGPTDRRVLWTDPNFPYSAVGRWKAGNFVCSGVLVGPRVVLTAKHCINIAENIPFGEFQPGYDNGDRLGSYKAIRYIQSGMELPSQGGPGTPEISADEYCRIKEDWGLAILREKEPIGVHLGFWGVNQVDLQNDIGKPKFYHNGYPGDRDTAQRPYRQDKIMVAHANRCNGYYPLGTDADTHGGQSGGPIWNFRTTDWVPEVYGVFSHEGGLSYFSGGDNMLKWIAVANTRYPAPS